MEEARLKQTEAGLVAESDGWFVLNVRDMGFESMPGGGAWAAWEPDGVAQQYGAGVHVLWPGDSPGRYHAESDQEGFLVLAGECILIVEGEERRLRQWDYFHCPPGDRAHHGRGGRGAVRGLHDGRAFAGQDDRVPRRPGGREARRVGRRARHVLPRGLRGPRPHDHARASALAA